MSRRHIFFIVLSAALAGGCDREEIRVYFAPKDEDHHAEEKGSEPPERARPQITWTLPEGWQQTEPGQVSVASFLIKSPAGDATVQVTPLPNLAGNEGVVVNMWREQLGQTPLSPEEVASALTAVEVAGESGKLFEISGNDQRRIVTAMMHQPDASWFFKLTGSDAVVAAQKPAFLEFLKSVRLQAPTAAAEPPSLPRSPAAPQFEWSVPDGWTAVAPGQMQVAKFTVPERNGAKAEVAVSVFPSDTGGTLANVNRWRKQIGLGEVDQAGLTPLVAELDPSIPGSVLVDLGNENRRMLGAIVPRDGQWFFFKLSGDAAAVTAERDKLIAFAKSKP